MKLLHYQFKFKTRTFVPILVAPYVIKRNDHPKKGKLIDVYVPYPNPFLLVEYKKRYGLGIQWTLYNNSVKDIVRLHKIPYRPLTCRHWPKTIQEERMLILLKHAVSDKEVFFKGVRNQPPGKFTILETGLFYVLDVYVRNYFFILLVAFQRRLGLSFAKGSTYIWFPDLEQLHGVQVTYYRTMYGIHLYLRNMRVLNGLPQLQFHHRTDDWSAFQKLFWWKQPPLVL